MRFDLEIPPLNNNKLVFIPEGNDVNSFLCPLSYYNVSTKDVLISDFMSAEEAFALKEFSADGYEIKNGPSFEITSDKIFLTHVYKYSTKLGVEIPLFYKYIIYDVITPDTIKITDYFGVEIDKSEYIVEVFDGKTYVYMNKTNNVLFIEFVSNSRFLKSLLNLVPVFQEATWESLAIHGKITDFEYSINGSVLSTTYNGKLFLSYKNNIRLFKKPAGNLSDSWNVRILNSNFEVTKGASVLKYKTPEFYRQHFDGSENTKLITMKKCQKIFSDVIKSQYEISQNMFDSVYVYIENFYTRETVYAFTTNSFYFDTQFKDNIYYSKINNITSDGLIYLPVQLKEAEVAYVTHYTPEEYLTYTKLNLNSPLMNNATYAAFYMKPNVSDTGSGVAHAIIGDFDDKTPVGDIGTVYFNKYEDYQAYIDLFDYLHISLVTVSPFVNNNMMNSFDVRRQSGGINDKKEAVKIDVDILYDELITGNIILPTNDSLIAKVNTDRLIVENKFKKDVDGGITDDTSLRLIDNIKDKLRTNLDITTKSILKID
jgi:hypothetical protein